MNCEKCKYSEHVPGTDLTACMHTGAHIEVNKAALRRGWVNYPFRFDPFWIKKCDSLKKEIGEK